MVWEICQFVKVLIVNTLITSLFVYRMTVLPSITNKLLCSIRHEITKFIWNNSKPKISYDIMIMPKEDGGAGLIDLAIKDKTLKISWIGILSNEQQLGKLIQLNTIPELGDYIWDCSLQSTEVSTFITDEFWCNVYSAWFEFKELCDDVTKCEYQMLWLNSNIRICNKPVIWKKAISKGLYYIKQLIHEGNWISHKEARNRYGLSVMSYNSLKAAIPRSTKDKIIKKVR